MMRGGAANRLRRPASRCLLAVVSMLACALTGCATQGLFGTNSTTTGAAPNSGFFGDQFNDFFRGQQPTRALRACLEPGKVPLVSAEQVTVEPGDVGHGDITAGEVRKALQITLVLDDGSLRGTSVEFEPAEIFSDCLGERDASGHSQSLPLTRTNRRLF